MEPSGGHMFISFLPMIVISIPFAIGNYFLAGAMNQSRALWVILSLVPLVNGFFFIYVFYVVVLYMIERLNRIATRLEAPASER